eukprot:2633576-Pleurochrysis_carterae.AAC.3
MGLQRPVYVIQVCFEGRVRVESEGGGIKGVGSEYESRLQLAGRANAVLLGHAMRDPPAPPRNS